MRYIHRMHRIVQHTQQQQKRQFSQAVVARARSGFRI
jgi:hypothetical protein